MTSSDGDRSRWHSRSWWTAVGGLAGAIAVLIAVLAWLFPQTPGGSSSGSTSALSAPDSQGTLETTTATGTLPTGTTTSSSGSPEGLSLFGAVTNSCVAAPDVTGNWFVEPTQLGRTDHLNSISCEMSGPGSAGRMEFLVPKHARRLVGTVGIPDTTKDTGFVLEFTFESFDGTALIPPARVTYGAPYRFEVDVTSTQRIKLGVRVIAAGGTTSQATWGSLSFTSTYGI